MYRRHLSAGPEIGSASNTDGSRSSRSSNDVLGENRRKPKAQNGSGVENGHIDTSIRRFPKSGNAAKNGPADLVEVDLQIRENAREHHTDEFHLSNDDAQSPLVLRRGQTFQMVLRFSRKISQKTDLIRVVFELGQVPQAGKGTRVDVTCTEKPAKDETSWWAHVQNVVDAEMTVNVNIGCNASIGRWCMKVTTSAVSAAGSSNAEAVSSVEDVFILFNPWCKSDSVYMENVKELNEYVLNDVGKIWRGSANSIRPTFWSYGQFEDVVLEACMLILERSRLGTACWANPVYVTRMVAAMVNSVDDHGVVEGSWDESFNDGVAPTEWTGSVDILRRYVRTKQPVKYGQCWVFAGVVTTVLRCLGIPCRPVTNYASAHDTDTTVTVDYHIDEQGQPLLEYNQDSVWNFHVWNDCWMQRPDLGAAYDGWQAIDATPQEKSQGIYRCGPAPVKAIRQGELGLAYDVPFIYAEVNADQCYWLHKEGSEEQVFAGKQTDSIGRYISTKAPGRKPSPVNEDRLDITDLYKCPEGSKGERMSVVSALFTGGSSNLYLYSNELSSNNDVEFALNLVQAIVIGQDFVVTLRMKNTAKQIRRASITVRVDACSYTGKASAQVKSVTEVVKLSSRQETNFTVKVTAADYSGKLQTQAAFAITCFAQVKETNQIYIAHDDFRLKKPDVKFKLYGKPAIGKISTFDAQLTNPLDITLTNCRFIIEGPGLMSTRKVPYSSAVPPKGEAVIKGIQMKPWKAGQRTLVAHFTSDQLEDVDGSLAFDVAA